METIIFVIILGLYSTATTPVKIEPEHLTKHQSIELYEEE